MRHYEVTFLVDPVLSGDEVKSAAEHIQKELEGFGATLVAVETMGLRQLAYPINRRSSGVYYSIEFASERSEYLPRFELNLKRDERLLRYLTVKLDKYGVKYNDDKRNGRVGKKRREGEQPVEAESAPSPEVVDLDAKS